MILKTKSGFNIGFAIPKGFEYKSEDALIQELWITQIEDQLDRNPNCELVWTGKNARALVSHQRALAQIIEEHAIDLRLASKSLVVMDQMSLWQIFVFRMACFLKGRRDRLSVLLRVVHGGNRRIEKSR